MNNSCIDKLLLSLPKILSGRFLLTIAACWVFFEFSDCLCQIMIQKCDILSVSDILNLVNMILIIMSNIFTFYFTRERYNKVCDEKVQIEPESIKKLN